MLPIDSTSASLLNNASQMASVAASSDATSTVKDTYLDQNSLNSVKAMGRKNDPQALKEISKKFEGMFVQQMLKSMREANEVFAEGDMLQSDEGKFHQEMLDQQMVLNLTSGRGIGLATSMYQQMQKMYGKAPAPEKLDGIGGLNGKSDGILDEKLNIKPIAEPVLKPLAKDTSSVKDASLVSDTSLVKDTSLTKDTSLAKETSSTVAPTVISRTAVSNSAIKAAVNNASKAAAKKTPEEFIAALMPFAEKAAAELHVNIDVILAQAALETGWGKHMLHDGKGNSSFNVFNIKKSAAWDGKTVGVSSVEFKEGVATVERSHFRHYESYTHSFSDYVNMLKNNPRYQSVLAAGNDSKGYADALEKAGYATDPKYAQKLKSLLNSDVIRSAVDARTLATNTATIRG